MWEFMLPVKTYHINYQVIIFFYLQMVYNTCVDSIVGGFELNRKLEAFKAEIKNKRVAVLGIGISNTPLIKYLRNIGVEVAAFDRSDREKLGDIADELEVLGVSLSLGTEYLNNLRGFDVIFRTPGMRYDIPELVRAREEGAEITSEMEIFFELCPAPIIAITGSDGKTTTTTLVYTILKEQGYDCWLGGNIGTPLLSRIDEIKEADKVVLELSSFQLHTMKRSPQVAVITNITPNHLDVHKSMEEYVEAKRNIFLHQTPDCKLVLNYDNDITRGFGLEAAGEAVFFSRVNRLESGALLSDGWLVYRKNGEETRLVRAEDIIIPGAHNIENYLAASAAVMDLVQPETIKKVATTFTGVEHRIELVRELDSVKYYNSSIDSSPNRTSSALNTFNQRVILIAGGKDKGIPYDALGSTLVKKVKCLILIGATADKIEKALQDEVDRTGNGSDIEVLRCSTYEEVVNTARQKAKKGDIVLLSPASTSFDMFKNFEERGNKFKELVKGL